MKLNTPNVNATYRCRTTVVCLGFVLGFIIILGRLVFLQVILAEEGADRARRQHHKSITLHPDRGLIVDRNGTPLTLNIDVPSLYATPASITNPSEVARKLAPVVDIPSRTLTKQLSKDHPFV